MFNCSCNSENKNVACPILCNHQTEVLFYAKGKDELKSGKGVDFTVDASLCNVSKDDRHILDVFLVLPSSLPLRRDV